jgi:hypothetical protein
MSEIEKEAREYCLNLILNTVLSDKFVLSDEYVFDPQTSHSVKFIHPRSLELAPGSDMGVDQRLIPKLVVPRHGEEARCLV